jgi:Fic family protein
MTHQNVTAEMLAYIRQAAAGPDGPPSASAIAERLKVSRRTVNRTLARLVANGQLKKSGSGPTTAYRPISTPARASSDGPPSPVARSAEAAALLAQLSRPLGSRTPVSYERAFVDDYVPNESFLMPRALADELYSAGRAQGQQPAGTVARKILEQLLIDLSWHSSRLEGNRVSLLDTQALFEHGRGDPNNPDITMLLNHKEAIEFMVNAVPEQGITVPVVRNLHGLLMQGLLSEPLAAGAIRRRIVTIEGSVYHPTQVPVLLEQMLEEIVARARLIRNPIEGAFFLWVNLAYLQPFEEGNRRTSRLTSNLPPLLYNCAPLSFLDVEQSDYAYAMLGVYEQRSVALAVELFETTYRRSIEKYRAALGAFGTPDPIRARYREALGEAIRRVVAGGESGPKAIASLGIEPVDLDVFTRLVEEELMHLAIYNCARYRLTIPAVDRWIAAGRPGLKHAGVAPVAR